MSVIPLILASVNCERISYRWVQVWSRVVWLVFVGVLLASFSGRGPSTVTSFWPKWWGSDFGGRGWGVWD